jgi:hypothetical protein
VAEADAIMKEIGDYVFQLPVKQQRLFGTQDEIQAVCEHHLYVWMCTYVRMGTSVPVTCISSGFQRK